MKRKNRILVVDDLKANTTLIKDLLASETLEVAAAYSGKNIIKKVKSYHFDLILLDIMMPGVSGLEICRELKKNKITRSVPVIFLTALNDRATIDEAFEAGGIDYITKPFNPHELKQKIKNHLELANFKADLIEAKEEAERLSRVKSIFLSNISHELRTPLNGIVSTLEMLRESGLNDVQKELLDIAGKSSEHLTHIVNDLLDLSMIESESLQLYSARFNLEELLYELLDLFKIQALKKNIRIDTQWLNCKVDLMGDKQRTRQILSHVLDNAIKFSNGGAVKFIVEAKQGADGVYRVDTEINDSGEGISPEVLDDIFEMFKQEDEFNNRKRGGMGTGLAITYKLVELMQGSISLESEKHVGTHIHIMLPFAQVQAQEEEPRGEGEEQRRQNLKPQKIMVVDDNQINLRIAGMVLDRMGHEVHSAENGRKALELFAQVRPDVVFMDIQMPVMDGLEATRAIRRMEKKKLWKRTPIIALTASAMKGDRDIFLRAGMDDYITKPFKKEDLENIFAGIRKKS